MTSTDPQRPVPLISVPTDVEAAAVITALSAHGIRAIAAGGYTAGLRAAAPGQVQVMVRQADLQEAQVILEELQPGPDPPVPPGSAGGSDDLGAG